MKRRGEGYQQKALRLIAEGKLVVPLGMLADAEIRHHPSCGFYLGRSCRCDPDIIVTRRGVA